MTISVTILTPHFSTLSTLSKPLVSLLRLQQLNLLILGPLGPRLASNLLPHRNLRLYLLLPQNLPLHVGHCRHAGQLSLKATILVTTSTILSSPTKPTSLG